MKILLFDNSGMIQKEDNYYTNHLNGLFLNDLLSCGNEITYFQFVHKNTHTINSFNLQAHGIKCKAQKPYRSKLLRYLVAYLKSVFEIKKSEFIYIYYPTSFKYVAFLSKLFGKKYGLYIRGMRGLNDRVSHWIYKNAYTIFTVSDYFTQYVNNIVGKNIANTIRPMIPFNEKDIVTNREYKEKNIYHILFLGRLDKDKGLEELLKATAILNKQKSNFMLTIVGDGEFMERAKEITNNLEISKMVKFTGSVYNSDEIKEYYTNSDIYILPTYHEGFPRTLYEAMIFGIPIITTFVGGIPTLMKDDFNCKEIKPKSVESIVEILTYAMNNYPKMGELAKNGTKTVAKIIDSKRLTHAQHLNQILNKK